MKDQRSLFKFLSNPPLFFTFIVVFLTLLSIGGSIVAVAKKLTGTLVYTLFAVTAIILIYDIFLIVKTAPSLKERTRETAKKYPFAQMFLSDYGFRTVAFAAISFVINIGFAIFNGVLGIIFRSLWFGALAAYYTLLSGIRLVVFLGGRRAKKTSGGDERKLLAKKLIVFRNCGFLLFVLEIALMAAVTQMALSRQPAGHSEITAITFAAYTVYKITLAIVNAFKARRLKDPLVQSFRNIGVTDAAVSLMSLQVTLIAVFSDGTDVESLLPLNAVTGFIVCAAAMVLGISMIIIARKRLKQLKKGGAGDDNDKL